MDMRRKALDVLRETSRTFFIPINGLPAGLKEAVASAYLCMRAIDEVEDHPTLDNTYKVQVLQTISLTLQATADGHHLNNMALAINAHQIPVPLPEVTLRVGEWALLAPPAIAPRIWDATAAMADRMAYWSSCNWTIRTEADLDRYTFSVAGSVGLLLSDLWAWYDGTQTDRALAVGFGRGLQAVNILRNSGEDRLRGVGFFPDGWTTEDMHAYAAKNLRMADDYTASLPHGPALSFCRIPLTLAHATLDALRHGQAKLSRTQVMAMVAQLIAQR